MRYNIPCKESVSDWNVPFWEHVQGCQTREKLPVMLIHWWVISAPCRWGCPSSNLSVVNVMDCYVWGCTQKFLDWVNNEIYAYIWYCWEATQRVMVAKLTRFTHKIVIQLHLVAESCTICSSHYKWPVWKLTDIPSYSILHWKQECSYYCTKGFQILYGLYFFYKPYMYHSKVIS